MTGQIEIDLNITNGALATAFNSMKSSALSLKSNATAVATAIKNSMASIKNI